MEAIDSICIPIMDNDDQVVEVHLDQLPDDSEEVLEVLRAEAAPLGLWLDFAKAYLQRDRVEQYVHILEEAVSPEASKFFEGRYGHERVQILCCLASYHVTMGVSEKDRGKKRDFFTEASRNLQAARQIDFEEQLPCLGLGVLALAKNETETAKREFTRATKLKSNGCTNVAGHLALAALHFNQGQYTEALQLYRKALREHPRCPPEVRLGIAASLFQMGNFNQAKLAFQRVLQLDPRCAEALLGLAVITFNDTDVHKALPSPPTAAPAAEA